MPTSRHVMRAHATMLFAGKYIKIIFFFILKIIFNISKLKRYKKKIWNIFWDTFQKSTYKYEMWNVWPFFTLFQTKLWIQIWNVWPYFPSAFFVWSHIFPRLVFKHFRYVEPKTRKGIKTSFPRNSILMWWCNLFPWKIVTHFPPLIVFHAILVFGIWTWITTVSFYLILTSQSPPCG
jgi:hypothetical protein